MADKQQFDDIEDDDINVTVLEEENVPLPGDSSFQRFTQNYITKPWEKLSKQQKTLIIITLTAIIILCLIVAILIPLTKTSTGTRSYYIRAEEVIWNYTPDGYNVVKNRPFNTYEEQFTTQQNNRIGSVYKKAKFFGYTDSTFTERIEQPDNQKHRGILGPIIRAEVGETIEVHVVNNLNWNISFHIDGLQYSKDNEGITYNDNTTHEGDVITPGSNYIYVFTISDTEGPASSDYSSVAYNYYSTVDVVSDFNSGLCGLVVITKKGSADADGAPVDVDFEGFLLVSVFDESKSYYNEENINDYLFNNTATDSTAFLESNRKYSVNGFLYGNVPVINITQGNKVRWYISALGEGSHTLLWSGQTLLFENARTGSIVMFPGTTAVADTIPLVSGIWLLESYGVEAKNGMSTLYNVLAG